MILKNAVDRFEYAENCPPVEGCSAGAGWFSMTASPPRQALPATPPLEGNLNQKPNHAPSGASNLGI